MAAEDVTTTDAAQAAVSVAEENLVVTEAAATEIQAAAVSGVQLQGKVDFHLTVLQEKKALAEEAKLVAKAQDAKAVIRTKRQDVQKLHVAKAALRNALQEDRKVLTTRRGQNVREKDK